MYTGLDLIDLKDLNILHQQKVIQMNNRTSSFKTKEELLDKIDEIANKVDMDLREVPIIIIKTLVDEMKKTISKRFDSDNTDESNKEFMEKALEISRTISILSAVDEQVTRILFAMMSETFRTLGIDGAGVAKSILN